MRKLIIGITAVFAILLATFSDSFAASEPVRVSGNGAYSWWTSPIVVQNPNGLSLGVINDIGLQRQLDYTSTNLSVFQAGTTTPPDDHNAPAISKEPGHPDLMFYTGHPGTMKYRRGYGAPKEVPWSFSTTYAQVLRRGEDVLIITRQHTPVGGRWSSIRYNSTTDTFQPWKFLHDSPIVPSAYITVQKFNDDPNNYHIGVYSHPNYVANIIRYTSRTFDELIAEDYTPFTATDLETVWTPPVDKGYKFRLLEVGDKRGITLLYYARWNNATTTPQYYYAKRSVSGTWTSKKIRSSGGAFWEHSNYIGGISLDERPNGNRFYIGYKYGNSWRLATYRINTTGDPHMHIVLASDTKPLVRPQGVGSGVIYQKLVKYTHFSRYRVEIYWIKSTAP